MKDLFVSSIMPTGNGQGCSWSPSREFLCVAHFTSPYITIYQTDQNLPTSGVVTIQGIKRDGT